MHHRDGPNERPSPPGLSPSPDGGHVPPDLDRARRALARLRARARFLLVAGAAMRLLAVAIAAVCILALADYVLRLPRGMRVALWVGGLGLAAYAARLWVLPALRFRPRLTDIALRLEQSNIAGAQDLRDALASGLDFESGDFRTGDTERQLAEGVVRRVGAAFSGVQARVGHLIKTRPAAQAAAAMLGAVAVVVAMSLAWPGLTGIGAARILTPWRDIHWPRTTQIADVTGVRVHPMGMSLEVRGILTRRPGALGQTPVYAHTRLSLPGRPDEAMRVRLSSQLAEATERGETGELLLGDIPIPAAQDDATEGKLTYWLETRDDRTQPVTVTLAAPPVVVGARLHVEPPAYASGVLADDHAAAAGLRNLGPGIDERAIAGPLLSGSAVRLSLEFNKEVRLENEPWVNDFLRAAGATGAVESAGSTVVLDGVLGQSARLEIRPTDNFGIRGDTEAVYVINVASDEPPTAAVLEPARDGVVLPSALVDVLAEGRDDVGLAMLSIEQRTARPPAGSQSGSPEPAGDWQAALVQAPASRALREARAEVSIDLASLKLVPGDEVWLSAVVQDGFEMPGQTHEAVRSSIRKLRIIGESDMIERLRAELAAVRQSAQRLDERQGQLMQELERRGSGAEQAEAQRSLTERIAAQRRVIRDMQERLERNRLANDSITELLDDVGDALDEASDASSRAEREMQAAQARAERADAARSEQETVRDELGRIVEMLDMGQDGWLVERELQRLLEEQRRLRQETSSLGERTAGRPVNTLTPQELSELDKVALRQQEAAERAANLLDSMSERARELSQVDPAQSAGLSQASSRGRQQQVAEAMQRAAEGLRANQPGQAGSSQDQAMQALEDMLEDIQSADRRRDEVLRRRLASLIESLESLVQQQRRELANLDAAQASGAIEGLEPGMVRVHTNTLGVLDQANASADTAPVARLIGQAGSAQEEAIKGLRLRPVNDLGAEEHEALALKRLEEARDEARRMDEEARQRDAARKRRELRAAYRDALEQQVALRGDVEPLVGQALDRRARQQVRVLGEKQETLRALLEGIARETEELSDAVTFAFAHERLDRETRRAAEALVAGRADQEVKRSQDAAVRILQSLVLALAESNEDPDFREQQGGGGGGSGGGSAQQRLFENLTQLKLLRSMQEEAMIRTREYAEQGGSEAELRELSELQGELGRLGQKLIDEMTRPSGPDPLDPFQDDQP